jgi:hypothetical protein
MISIVFTGHLSVRKRTLAPWLFIVFFLATAATGANPQKMSFPGVSSESQSPNGRFVIKNIDSDSEDPAHRLTLIDRRRDSEIKVYRYGRSVDVLWSPNSTAFVINDHEGSDAAHPVLFTQPWSAHFSDLRQKLIDFLRARNEARSVLENDHVYFTAERWLGDDEIVCKLTGYGAANPKGFTKHYVYKIDVGFRSYK